MKLVADTNIAVSAIVRSSTTLELLFHPALELYAPALLFEELREHETEITRKAGISPNEFNGFLAALGKVIKVLPQTAVRQFIPEAEKIIDDPDDLPFAAAAIALTMRAGALDDPGVVEAVLRDGADPNKTYVQDVDECGIWSNDKHFTSKTAELFRRFKINVWTTTELYHHVKL